MTIAETDGAAGPHPPIHGAAEVRVPSTGAAWAAEIDECEDGVMRLRLQPALLGAMPTWLEGTAVDCTVDSGRHSCYAEATVLRQSGGNVWLRVPNQWLQADRRTSPRRLGGFIVSYGASGREGTAACVDISEGGMCLEVGESLPLRERMELLFLLPGDRPHTWAMGTVVYVAPPDERGRIRLGIAFSDVTPCSRERIQRYCHSVVGD